MEIESCLSVHYVCYVRTTKGGLCNNKMGYSNSFCRKMAEHSERAGDILSTEHCVIDNIELLVKCCGHPWHASIA